MIRMRRIQHVFGLLTVSLVVLVAFGQAQAGIMINEITLNSENSGGSGSDSDKEFIELLSDTGGVESLTGLTVLFIEGDGSGAGLIEKALSLDGFSTGTNGLFLWRDSADVLLPAPNPATTLNVADFVPDIENGSATFAVVSGFSGMLGDDLDTDNDGAFDVVLPFTSVIDAVGVKDSAATDNVYGALLGGVDFASVPYNADSIIRLSGSGLWVGVDVDETISEFPGPYTLDDTQAQFADGTAFTPSTALTFNTLSPGNANPALVPEPASIALLGFAGLLFAGVFQREARKN